MAKSDLFRDSQFFDEDQPVVVRLRGLARLNGQVAKQEARRLTILVKAQATIKSPALSNEVAHLAKLIAYHLRQATLIGQHIDGLERKASLKQAPKPRKRSGSKPNA